MTYLKFKDSNYKIEEMSKVECKYWTTAGE